MMFSLVAGLTAITAYLAGCAFLLRAMTRKQPLPVTAVLGLGTAALPLHAAVVAHQVYGPYGLDLGLFHIISLVGWLIAAMHILIASRRALVGLSLAAFPAAALSLLLSLLFRAPYTPLAHLAPGVEGHIVLSILAYSVLFMSALHALLLSVQNRELKQRKRQGSLLHALPPLQTMEAVLFDLIGVGFALLSMAILSGFLTLDNMFAQHVVHKTVFSLIAWSVFGVLLLGHHRQGWRGQTAIRMTLAGFALLLVGFYGSKIVLELILKKV